MAPRRTADAPWIGPASVAVIVGTLAIPLAFALSSIRVPPGPVFPTAPDASPLGYTKSLGLFLIPLVVVGVAAVRTGWGTRYPHSKRAAWWTLGALLPLGVVLDFAFGTRVLEFGSPASTLGYRLPALDWDDLPHLRARFFPIEEIVFYGSGFAAILATYLWADTFWLAKYSEGDALGPRVPRRRALRFHPVSLVAGVAVAAAGWALKSQLEPAGSYPVYWWFLTAVAFVPSIGLYETVRPLVNWQALSLTLGLLLFVCVGWEATLAIPYGWWGYQPRSLVGLYVDAWFGMPVEAILVWVAGAWVSVVVFEFLRLLSYSTSLPSRPTVRQVLMRGAPDPSP